MGIVYFLVLGFGVERLGSHDLEFVWEFRASFRFSEVSHSGYL